VEVVYQNHHDIEAHNYKEMTVRRIAAVYGDERMPGAVEDACQPTAPGREKRLK